MIRSFFAAAADWERGEEANSDRPGRGNRGRIKAAGAGKRESGTGRLLDRLRVGWIGDNGNADCWIWNRCVVRPGGVQVERCAVDDVERAKGA
jgi:hypothetical protein